MFTTSLRCLTHATHEIMFRMGLILMMLCHPAVGHSAQDQAPATQNSSIQSYASSRPATPLHEHTFLLTRLLNEPRQLNGLRPQTTLAFTLRRDRLPIAAELALAFMASPALLTTASHLRVTLNDEPMAVIPLSNETAVEMQRHTVSLNPTYLSSYNRIGLELIGRLNEACHDPAHPALWLELGGQTQVRVSEEAVITANDLTFFPEPFLDLNDMAPLQLRVVFPGQPSSTLLEAAGIVTSALGAKASWRPMSLQAFMTEIPNQHAIILASNQQRPAFLQQFPAVDQPLLAVTSTPDQPFRKLLLVLGKNDTEVKVAASALADQAALLRGAVQPVSGWHAPPPRKPYDAPNWVRTDGPVSFADLIDYSGQLNAHGVQPTPIRLNLNLPPDLFMWRSRGVPLTLNYRYTSPLSADDSRLTIKLNGGFVTSAVLGSPPDNSGSLRVRLWKPQANTWLTSLHPQAALSESNPHRLDLQFNFGSLASTKHNEACRNILLPEVHGVIEPGSTIDFSGHSHYLAMPDLRAYANSGFPFSRMADLSDTVAVVPADASAEALSVFLQSLATLGAQTGYPAFGLKVVPDHEQAQAYPADILWFGDFPEATKNRIEFSTLATALTATLTTKPSERPSVDNVRQAGWATTDAAPMAAIVGLASPWHQQRSVVALLASSVDDHALLQQALQNPDQRRALTGSVAIVRTSGVISQSVGPSYFVGNLPWWQWLWFHLANRPWVLGMSAALVVLLLGILLWLALQAVARRRLHHGS